MPLTKYVEFLYNNNKLESYERHEMYFLLFHFSDLYPCVGLTTYAIQWKAYFPWPSAPLLSCPVCLLPFLLLFMSTITLTPFRSGNTLPLLGTSLDFTNCPSLATRCSYARVDSFFIFIIVFLMFEMQQCKCNYLFCQKIRFRLPWISFLIYYDEIDIQKWIKC